MKSVTSEKRCPDLWWIFGRLCVIVLVLLAMRISGRAVPIVALVEQNKLIVFDSGSPGTITGSGAITGLPAGEEIVALDFRPATGQLYGLGKSSRLYVINPFTRVAVQIVGAAPFSPSLNDMHVGFDFDPTADRVRIIADQGASRQNLLVDPRTGTADSQTPSGFAPADVNAGQQPRLVGIAYDNNFVKTTHSVLYAIHRSTNSIPFLVAVAPPNGGQVKTVGSLFSDATSVSSNVGFDISPIGQVAYAVLKTGDPTARLYSVSLVTGAAALLGDVGEPGVIFDLAVVPPRYTIFAVNAKNELLKFDSAYPETILSRLTITGMIGDEQITELDFRQNGELHGLGRSADGSISRLYRINAATGIAFSDRAPIQPSPSGDAGFDFVSPFFHPTIGFIDDSHTIRIVTQSQQNFRVRDNSAIAESDPQLAYATSDPNAGRIPNVIASAHANIFHSPAVSGTETHFTLYGFDRADPFSTARTLLVRHAPKAPSGDTLTDTGELITVGSPAAAGIPVGPIGFDIASGVRAPAFATFISIEEDVSKFFLIDLETGAATLINPVDTTSSDTNARRVRDLAIFPSGEFSLGETRLEIIEDCTAVTVTVTRTGDISNEATVNFETGAGNFSPEVTGLGTASRRSDLTPVSGTLFFAAGQTSATFNVPINEDTRIESGFDHGIPFSGEDFGVTLSNPSAGYALFHPPGSGPSVTILIRDDGDTGTGNSIDDSAAFVCAHYHDFLNRHPEAGGLQFWIGGIESCGTDTQCRELRRIDASAAFYLSIEFQESGFLVYRTYQAAFGRTPVPLSLSEFLPDTQAIGRGVVVRSGNWQEKLEVNKREFFDDFVMRAPFTSLYPSSMSAAQFIDALNANTGGALSLTERDDLVNELASGRINRAQALRAVADNELLRQREFNRAFVLMQYFGYLRRNPNDSPDTGFGGFNFWLNKLNEFNGDFRKAEMVKAFISSIEYRKRFGP